MANKTQRAPIRRRLLTVAVRNEKTSFNEGGPQPFNACTGSMPESRFAVRLTDREDRAPCRSPRPTTVTLAVSGRRPNRTIGSARSRRVWGGQSKAESGGLGAATINDRNRSLKLPRFQTARIL